MRNLLLLTLFSSFVLGSIAFASNSKEQTLYKEYTLESGESIAGLIFITHNKSREEKLSLIESSLRVNRLTKSEAKRLPVGESVLIPVDIFDFHKARQESAEKSSVNAKNMSAQDNVEVDYFVESPVEAAANIEMSNNTESVLDKEILTEVKFKEESLATEKPLVAKHGFEQEENFIDGEDNITTQNSGIARIDTDLKNTFSTGDHDRPPFFIDFSMQKTQLRTDKSFNDNDNQKGEIQTLHLGLYALFDNDILFGGEVFKDTAESRDNFASDKISSRVGASKSFQMNSKLSLSAATFYQDRNYNFEGLSIGGFGQVNQKSVFLGAKGTYALNDYFAIVGGIDYALYTIVDNVAFNAIDFENTNLLQMECSLQYSFNSRFQTYLSVANERNTWEKGSKVINYNSELLKLGLIFRI